MVVRREDIRGLLRKKLRSWRKKSKERIFFFVRTCRCIMEVICDLGENLMEYDVTNLGVYSIRYRV